MDPDKNYYIAGVMVDGFDAEKTANLILTNQRHQGEEEEEIV